MVKDYIEFQDRNAPLAYLISIRLYATWLHGDERGSMNRRTNNLYGTPKNPFNVNLAKHEISLLKHSPLKLDARHVLLLKMQSARFVKLDSTNYSLYKCERITFTWSFPPLASLNL